MELISSIESAWSSWSLNFEILLLIFWENNLPSSGWIINLVLYILFQIDDVSSPDVDQFIFLISFGSDVFISLDQNDKSVDTFVAFKIFIITYRNPIFDLLKRWIPWINIFCRIESDWSKNQNFEILQRCFLVFKSQVKYLLIFHLI